MLLLLQRVSSLHCGSCPDLHHSESSSEGDCFSKTALRRVIIFFVAVNFPLRVITCQARREGGKPEVQSRSFLRRTVQKLIDEFEASFYTYIRSCVRSRRLFTRASEARGEGGHGTGSRGHERVGVGKKATAEEKEEL
uniref:Uncharacterized protein n=1 Tax=Physcomitrium patens TaxID=3218 RepID=A0A2K1J8D3_PHYPA|nr:hypothetical protein PHYPA_020893 [Physcomitrium patens]